MKKIEINVDLGDRASNLAPATLSEYYPEISFTEDKPCDIPDEGILTVKYRLVRHGEDTRVENSPLYNYTIQIEKLIDAVPEKEDVISPTRKIDEAGEALDALVAEKVKEKDASY